MLISIPVTTDDVQLTPVQGPGDEHTGTTGTPEVLHDHPVVRDPLLEKPAAISHIVSWPADMRD